MSINLNKVPEEQYNPNAHLEENHSLMELKEMEESYILETGNEHPEPPKKRPSWGLVWGLIVVIFVLLFILLIPLLSLLSPERDSEHKLDVTLSELKGNFNKIAQEESLNVKLGEIQVEERYFDYCLDEEDICVNGQIASDKRLEDVSFDIREIKSQEEYEKALNLLTVIMRANDPKLSSEEAYSILNDTGITYEILKSTKEQERGNISKVLRYEYDLSYNEFKDLRLGIYPLYNYGE